MVPSGPFSEFNYPFNSTGYVDIFQYINWVFLKKILLSGKALCSAFAQKGLFVTVVDFSEENGREVAVLVQKENSKFHRDLRVPSSVFVKCDVSNAGKRFRLFKC